MKTNVFSLVSPRTGRAVPNQFVIIEDGVKYFKSYSTIIAKIEKGVITLDSEMWAYSRTTIKYLIEFLNCYNMNVFGVDSIRKAIAQNEIKLSNLN